MLQVASGWRTRRPNRGNDGRKTTPNRRQPERLNHPVKRRSRRRENLRRVIIAKRIEEDIVLGRRHPRERLVEQDLG